MKFGDGLDIQIKRQHLNICTTRTEKVKPSVELRKHQFYTNSSCLQLSSKNGTSIEYKKVPEAL